MTNKTNELYIVTGAAGNLGSAIVRELANRGKPVRAFVLRGEEAAGHLPKEAQVIEGDVTDMPSLETLFADIPENTTNQNTPGKHNVTLGQYRIMRQEQIPRKIGF